MFNSQAQNISLPLWADSIPNARKTNQKEVRTTDDILKISKINAPSIDVFLPSKRTATNKAVLICPGGGYGMLAYDWEGTDIAKWFNTIGIAAIVLKYRLPEEDSNITPYKSPLIDAQRAMRLVRKNADEWNINKNEIGIMGFSAGGHLASSLGTNFQENLTDYQDKLAQISARPNFMILMYPVISMQDGITHRGSKDRLLSEKPSKELINKFSNELQVNPDTPPTFIVHAGDDPAVPVENSLLFYKALRKYDIPAEMHIYPAGGHGFSMARENPSLSSWTNLLKIWLQELE